MSKNKSTILLSILSVVVAAILVFTFIQFPVGVSNYVGAVGGIQLDYDLEGGVAYTLTLSSDNEEEVEDVDQVVKTIGKRLEALGYNAYTIKTLQNSDPAVLDKDIRIEVKNSGDYTDGDMDAVLVYGDVKFFGGTESDPVNEIFTDIEPIKSSSYLDYTADFGHRVLIEFTSEAIDELFAAMDAKEASQSYYLKITCGEDNHDGHSHEKSIFSAELKKEYFDGNKISISNISSKAEAMRMALQIKEGGIAYDYHYESETITSHFGQDLAKKVMVSIITLIVVLAVLYVVIYKGLGVITALSTLLFILGETWLMIGVPGITLSMGGVIGIISATVVCAISMFMFAQRVKDEYASSKKTVKAAISKGFRQSLLSTINLHVVAGVIALALFIIANGVLKNFAITLGIGLAVSLISSLVFTRMYTALILPLAKDKEKFLRFKRAEQADEEVTEA